MWQKAQNVGYKALRVQTDKFVNDPTVRPTKKPPDMTDAEAKVLAKALAAIIAEKSITIIIANATLMSLFHLRNVHLSERARTISKECDDLCQPPKQSLNELAEKRELLRAQAGVFIDRYRSMSRAFCLVTLTLVCTVFSIVLCSMPLAWLKLFGLVSALFGFIFLICALVLGGFEFLRGHRTLEQQMAILDQEIQKTKRPPEKPPN